MWCKSKILTHYDLSRCASCIVMNWP